MQADKYVEKRRHPRIPTENLVGYVLFDDNRKKIDHGKGRTINLSQSGALLETTKPLQGSFILLITIDLDGTKVKVKGRVVSSRKADLPDCYYIGIEFIGPRNEQHEAIVAFVKAYQRRKHSAQQRVDTSFSSL